MDAKSGHTGIESAGFDLLLDHTSAHRLSFLIDPHSPPARSTEEAVDALHLIEAAVMAQSITIMDYEGDRSSSEETARLIALTEDLRADRGGPLFSRDQLTIDSQLQLARKAAKEIFLLLEANAGRFDTPDDPRLAHINPLQARPRDLQWPTASFWSQVCDRRLSADQIVEFASEHIQQYGGEGLFAYGIAHLPEARDRVLTSYKKHGPWSSEDWEKRHVLHRIVFNELLADQSKKVYAPGVARAALSEQVHSVALTHFRKCLMELMELHQARMIGKTEWLEPYRSDIELPLPLIGLAALPKHRSPTALIDRLVTLRNDEGMKQLRRELAKLHQADDPESDGPSSKNIQTKCRQLQISIANRLGLEKQRVLPWWRINPISLPDAAASALTIVPDTIDFVRAKAIARSRRVILLSRMVQRCAQEATLQTAVHRLLRYR